MADYEPRLGKLTGETISWYAREPDFSNACCLYCGRPVSGQDAVPSDKEHLIARNFVPQGTMGGHQFNFIFRACRTCNARKANAERHVSSVTLFNSPARSVDPRAEAAASRKGKSDFHPSKKGVLVQHAHQELTTADLVRRRSVSEWWRRRRLTGMPRVNSPSVTFRAFSR
jgi:hypothetical protein